MPRIPTGESSVFVAMPNFWPVTVESATECQEECLNMETGMLTTNCDAVKSVAHGDTS